MKNVLKAFALAALIVLAASCATEEKAENIMVESSDALTATNIAEPSEEYADLGNDEEKPQELTGRLVGSFTGELNFDHTHKLASAIEKEHFSFVMASLSEKAASVTVGINDDGVSPEGIAFTSEQVRDIVEIVSNIEFSAFETPKEPSGNGNSFVAAVYDSDGNKLIQTAYDGLWLILEDETGTFIFDGGEDNVKNNRICEYVMSAAENS